MNKISGGLNSRWHNPIAVRPVPRYSGPADNKALEAIAARPGWRNGAKVYIRPMNADVIKIRNRILHSVPWLLRHGSVWPGADQTGG